MTKGNSFPQAKMNVLSPPRPPLDLQELVDSNPHWLSATMAELDGGAGEGEGGTPSKVVLATAGGMKDVDALLATAPTPEIAEAAD